MQLVEGIGCETQHRSGCRWHQPNGEGSPGEDLVKGALVRRAVGPIPTEEVSRGQVDEDQANNACPDQVTGAKIIAN